VCVLKVIGSPSRLTRKAAALVRVLPTLDLSCEDNAARWKWKSTHYVYYESRKRELKIRLMNEGRSDERLKVRVEESTYLTYTGLHDKTN
jgi:hypothetical protein